MTGGVFEGRLGLNMQLSENLYWHAAASFETGSKQQAYGADAGIRYMFGKRKSAAPVETPEATPAETPTEPAQTAVAENTPEQPVETVPETVSDENNVATQDQPEITEPQETVVVLPPEPITPVAVNADPDKKVTETNQASFLKAAGLAKLGAANARTLPIPSMGVLFKIGKSDISPYYKAMLDEFVVMYRITDGQSIITVDGYASKDGRLERNKELSKERAEKVAAYLVSQGIPKNKIEQSSAVSNNAKGIFSSDPNCTNETCDRRADVGIKK